MRGGEREGSAIFLVWGWVVLIGGVLVVVMLGVLMSEEDSESAPEKGVGVRGRGAGGGRRFLWRCGGGPRLQLRDSWDGVVSWCLDDLRWVG